MKTNFFKLTSPLLVDVLLLSTSAYVSGRLALALLYHPAFVKGPTKTKTSTVLYITTAGAPCVFLKSVNPSSAVEGLYLGSVM